MAAALQIGSPQFSERSQSEAGQPPLNSFRVLDHATTTGENGGEEKWAKLICHFFENIVASSHFKVTL